LKWVYVRIAFANIKLNFRISRNGLIAGIHNSAKVWVAHTEDTISEKNNCRRNYSIIGLQISKWYPKEMESVRDWIRLQYLYFTDGS